ncbi:ABC transporter permease [Coprothermobacter platensis]|uniref:ABC transporter permease n=1 Tax=Coprothermobacter platensis TaxID=108819 RepID=UPI000373B467|nr:ABC transporter permease [Coprothermobacter platensis]
MIDEKKQKVNSRERWYRLLEGISPVLGFLFAMVVMMIVVWFIGESPSNALGAIISFSFSQAGIAYIISQSVPIIISGAANAVAFQGGLFNIGVEGQYLFGALCAGVAGAYLNLPTPIHILVVVLAGMAGGMLWALIPILLKVYKGVHEVIGTIMMNQIASAVVLYLVNGPFNGVRGQALSYNLRTPYLKPTAVFPSLHKIVNSITGIFGFKFPNYVAVDFSWVIAIVVVIGLWFLIFKSSLGLRIRWVGQNPSASVYAGVDIKKTLFTTMMISGAIAGLVGLQEVAYISKFFTPNITKGLGFTGLAVALLARNNPIGVVFAGLLFSFLTRAGYGLQMYTKVPNSLINAISGIMILSVVVFDQILRRYVRTLRRKEVGQNV